ncbi:MAG: ABC transporter ATP-binding protein [Lachnospiraceae bacterium]|nr:ABC transporter ATP-binding protein [Lachnospiraceae bacterium]
MKILEVKNITKRYEDLVAVNDISFSVEKGEILGIVGPNGAGKSTTMNMISGLLVPDDGTILFEEGMKFKGWHEHIGLVPQDLAIYPDLSAKENVTFFAALYGLKGGELKKQVDEALKTVGLLEQGKKHSEKFSGGMKRRLNIACAIAHNPKLIIMDEPTVGIDPQSRNYILEGIKKLKKAGTTVIYTSHYMEEVEEICDRILIVDHGRIVESGTIEDIRERYQSEGKIPSLEEVFLLVTGKELRD